MASQTSHKAALSQNLISKELSLLVLTVLVHTGPVGVMASSQTEHATISNGTRYPRGHSVTSLESSSLALLLNSALKESRCMTVQSKSGMIQKQLRTEKTFSSFIMVTPGCIPLHPLVFTLGQFSHPCNSYALSSGTSSPSGKSLLQQCRAVISKKQLQAVACSLTLSTLSFWTP